MRASDIEHLRSVGRPTLSPDGTVAVVSVTRPDLGADATVGQLWRVDVTSGEHRRLTRGFRDTAPRFSPDGRTIAFLRAGRTTPPQLQVVAASGGEPVALSDARLGVGDFAWAPDGASIAFVAREPEHGRYGTVDGLEAAGEPPRRITTFKYRSNGIGHLTDRPARLYVVDLPDADAEPPYEPAPHPNDDAAAAMTSVPPARRLLAVDADVRSPEFAPDGGAVYLIGALHEGRDTDLRNDVYRLPLAAAVGGGAGADALERVTDRTLSVDAFAIGPDGRVWVTGAHLGDDGRDFVARNSPLHLVDGGVTRVLTDAETMNLGEAGAHITVLDTASVLVQNQSRGAVELLRVSADGAAETLTGDDLEVTGHAAAAGRIVVSAATAESAGELFALDEPDDGEDAEPRLRRLTDAAADLRDAGLLVPDDTVIRARDGYPVHGWVITPAGPGPHPVLLNIHGGPFAQYGVHVFDEVQVYADAGYAVVFCNPRGSAGYGQEHGRAIRHRMGTVDMTDVLDFLDGAIAAHPTLDGARVGIMGGSYGGYLTAWTIAHEHRFAGAIVERGYLDPEAFVGTSDIGSFFSDEYIGTDAEAVRAQSPQAVVGEVRTPTLVLHSELDLRCPLSQAERYYASLKRAGVETELLVFPGENHELSRGGRPRHRVQRLEAVLEWWARHLPVGS